MQMTWNYTAVMLSCVESDLQQDLQSVNSWLCVNRLTLSIKKSNVMLIGSCQKLKGADLHVTVDGKQLSRVSSVKYLGLHLDEHLTWHQHTANVLQRVYSRVHCLYRLRPLPAALLSRLYCIFVLPILDYCDVVWTPSSVHHFRRLERLHWKFQNPSSETDSTVCVTLAERRRFHTAIQIYKALHHLSPPYLHDTFQYVAVTGRASRNVHCLFVPRV